MSIDDFYSKNIMYDCLVMVGCALTGYGVESWCVGIGLYLALASGAQRTHLCLAEMEKVAALRAEAMAGMFANRS